MKILMVNKFLYPRGGCETYMLNLAEELNAKGHEIEYFGMYDEKNTVGNSLGLYTTNMDFHSKGLSRFLYPFKIIYSTEAKRNGISTMIQISALDTTAAIVPFWTSPFPKRKPM